MLLVKKEMAKRTGIPESLIREVDGFPKFLECPLLTNQMCSFQDDGYYISFQGNSPKGQTALIILDNDDHFIWYYLKGDYRKEFSEICEQGLDACVKFYQNTKLLEGE